MPSSQLTILANPGHGNGATTSLLFAAEAIQQVSACPVNVIFPYFGHLQKDIIERRRNPLRNISIYFDANLGAILSVLVLRNNNFQENVRAVARHQKAAQERVRQYCARGLTVTGIDGRSKCFVAGDLDFELNHGSRVCMLDPAYYFFPCLLSDLLRRSEELMDSDRDRALPIIEELESQFKRIFLPVVHTFSWDASWRPGTSVSFIPFPRPAESMQIPVSQPGIMVMPSGVGSAPNSLLVEAAVTLRTEIAAFEQTDLAFYCPPGKLIPELPNAIEINPRAISNTSLRLVVGRAGWGTLWECINSETPFVAIPAIPGDDPEILFNLRTLESTQLGIVWRGQPGVYSCIEECKKRMSCFISEVERDFGTRNGLEVMASQILENL